jgi:integrase
MVSVQRSPTVSYVVLPEGTRRGSVLTVREPGAPVPPKPRLLERVRAALRIRHDSRRTEKAYVAWILRYILFHGKRHPAEMGAPELTRFLSSLAVDGKVAASTQNQALSALLFFYRAVLELDLPWLDDVVRAKRPQRLPIVLTREEVRAALQPLDGVPRLMAHLLYGAGLRLLECCRLRVQDVDFGSNQIVVRTGKGDKDRVTMLPAVVKADLARHLEGVGPTLQCVRLPCQSPMPAVAAGVGRRGTPRRGVAEHRSPRNPDQACKWLEEQGGTRVALTCRSAIGSGILQLFPRYTVPHIPKPNYS